MNAMRALCIAILANLCVGCLDRSAEIKYEIYDTVDEAKSEGAFRRGWLPDWIPNDAHDIHEHHDLDTNVRAFSFKMKSPDKFFLPEQCRDIKSALKPNLKTKLFPKNVHKIKTIKTCKTLFVVMDSRDVVHAWGKK